MVGFKITGLVLDVFVDLGSLHEMVVTPKELVPKLQILAVWISLSLGFPLLSASSDGSRVMVGSTRSGTGLPGSGTGWTESDTGPTGFGSDIGTGMIGILGSLLGGSSEGSLDS